MLPEPVYRLRFDYPESGAVELQGEEGTEVQHLLHALRRIKGRFQGAFRGTHFARRRTEQTYLTAFKTLNGTDDGVTVLHSCSGFGRPRAPP